MAPLLSDCPFALPVDVKATAGYRRAEAKTIVSAEKNLIVCASLDQFAYNILRRPFAIHPI
jgi:hypothetical protein